MRVSTMIRIRPPAEQDGAKPDGVGLMDRITDFGRRIATEEVERLREVVRFAHPKFPSKSLAS